MNNEIPTPRTDAFQPTRSQTAIYDQLKNFARTLERELAEAKAEVERLKEESNGLLISLRRCLAAIGPFDSTNYDDYGGPHLAEGIKKLGSERDALAAQVNKQQARLDHSTIQLDHLLAHCKDPECSTCAKIICPHGEELHFHHDGCPSCAGWDELKEALAALTRENEAQKRERGEAEDRAFRFAESGERGWKEADSLRAQLESQAKAIAAMREALRKCEVALAVFEITDRERRYDNICEEWRAAMLDALAAARAELEGSKE